MFTLAKLQEEQKAWQSHNFPGRAPWMPLLGIVEEACDELSEARAHGDEDQVRDAVADVVIFMADFCTGIGLILDVVYDGASQASAEHAPLKSLDVYVGKLAHSYLKMSQGIRGTPQEHLADIGKALNGILRQCMLIAGIYNFNMLAVIESVWSEVRQRDFVLYPKNGRPPVDPMSIPTGQAGT